MPLLSKTTRFTSVAENVSDNRSERLSAVDMRNVRHQQDRKA